MSGWRSTARDGIAIDCDRVRQEVHGTGRHRDPTAATPGASPWARRGALQTKPRDVGRGGRVVSRFATGEVLPRGGCSVSFLETHASKFRAGPVHVGNMAQAAAEYSRRRQEKPFLTSRTLPNALQGDGPEGSGNRGCTPRLPRGRKPGLESADGA